MTLDTSIDAGLRYLRSQQADAGFWSDWQLPPGESRMWTTAYVGYRLSSVSDGRLATLEGTLARAEAWLRASEFSSGGWGYSDDTGPDADSTSLAVLFLRARAGGFVSDASLRRICEHQQPDGGFSTFTSEASWGSWVESHPDVSAVALLALMSASALSPDELGRGLRYARAHVRADGLWNAFWWTSCLYATEGMLAFLQTAGEPLDVEKLAASLRSVPTPSAFESALRLLCLARVGDAALITGDAHVQALMTTQCPDGSWPSAPVLRLTSREISEPWSAADPGPLFCDTRRLFATSTAVAALAAVAATTSITLAAPKGSNSPLRSRDSQ